MSSSDPKFLAAIVEATANLRELTRMLEEEATWRQGLIASDAEIHEVFNILWTRSVHTPHYNKKDWQRLQNMLYSRGIKI